MMIIKDNVLIEVTPELVAEMFCDMDSEEQARFFNGMADIISTWGRDFCFQLQYVTDEPSLSACGREVMQQIGEYSGV